MPALSVMSRLKAAVESIRLLEKLFVRLLSSKLISLNLSVASACASSCSRPQALPPGRQHCNGCYWLTKEQDTGKQEVAIGKREGLTSRAAPDSFALTIKVSSTRVCASVHFVVELRMDRNFLYSGELWLRR